MTNRARLLKDDGRLETLQIGMVPRRRGELGLAYLAGGLGLAPFGGRRMHLMAKIAMPVGEGFEDSEFGEPCRRFKITSRKPDDLDAFCQAILNRLPMTIGRAHPQEMVG